MKSLILAVIAVLPMFSFGKPSPVWTVDELRRRFEVRGEMYELDPTGKVVRQKGHTWNVWKPLNKTGKIQNHWSSITDEYGISLKHNWEVQDDGSIKAVLEHFKVADKKTTKERLKKEEFIIENLEPLTFVAFENKDKKVVIRLTPDFAPGETVMNVSEVPLAGTDVMITDNEGYVWAQHMTHGGKYSGFGTYKGTLFLSYYPFAGSKEMGVASGNELQLYLDDKKLLTFTSKTAYLPGGMQAKIYGIYHPDRKSGKFASAYLMDRDNEADYLERIKTWPN